MALKRNPSGQATEVSAPPEAQEHAAVRAALICLCYPAGNSGGRSLEFDLERIKQRICKLSGNPHRIATAKRFLYANIEEVKTYIEQKNFHRQNPECLIEFKDLNRHLQLVLVSLFLDSENARESIAYDKAAEAAHAKRAAKKAKPKLDPKGKRVRVLGGSWHPVTDTQLKILEKLFEERGGYLQGSQLPF
jgi:hypothetical protein